jgi:pimeloyl-ACP methyl ester carboxylesterase
VFPAIAIVIVTILGSFAQAIDWSHSPVCQQFQLFQSLKVPLTLQSESKKIEIKYRVYDGLDSKAKTILFIAGGPEASMFLDDPWSLYGLPRSHRVVLMDHRGFGCNFLRRSDVASGIDSVSTIRNAKDWAMLIADLQRKQILKDGSYVVVSHSYGTRVATILDSLIHQSNLPKPSSQILLGTQSIREDYPLKCDMNNKAFAFFLQNTFGPSWTSLIAVSGSPDTFELDAEFWRTRLFRLFRLDSRRWLDEVAIIETSAKGKQPFPSYYYQNLQSMMEIFQKDQDEYKRLYAPLRTGADSPIQSSYVPEEMVKSLINLETNRLHTCDSKKIEEVSTELSQKLRIPIQSINKNKWATRSWQMKSQTIYFHGLYDTMTPLNDLKDHMSAQQNIHRIVLLYRDGGHLLTGNSNFQSCLESAISASNDFISELQTSKTHSAHPCRQSNIFQITKPAEIPENFLLGEN